MASLSFPQGNPAALESGQSASLGVTVKKDATKTSPTVLDSYRSVTYNFTLAALDKNDLDNYTYASSNDRLKYIILKSGGKGDYKISQMQSLSAAQVNQVENPVYDQRDFANNQKKLATTLKFNQDVIKEYNDTYSTDYFIDNVEFNGIGAFRPYMGAALGTTLKFSVFEPNGINGFIEALHVASVAAGYPTYIFGAAFLLKVEFWGYYDQDTTEDSKPEKIDSATRYFPFTFTGVEVELTPDGTRYNCSGTSYGDQGFGNPNVLKAPINMTGSTVKEILTDLFNKLQAQVEKEAKDQSKNNNQYDRYEIKFPVRQPDGTLDFDTDNEIAFAKVSNLNRTRQIYVMPDPGENANLTGKKDPKDPKTDIDYRYNPQDKVQVQFNEGRNIHDCISGIVVDSEYIRKIYEVTKQPDEFVNYFIVQIFVEPLDSINVLTKTNYKKYVYVITPYKVHFTRVPGFQTTFDTTKLIKNYVWKRYNYTYTGKNVNVLNFKIDFNNLFFDAVPRALANSDYSAEKNATKPEADQTVNRSNSKVQVETENIVKGNGINQPNPTRSVPTEIQSIVSGGAIKYGDAYQTLSKNLHESVINSMVNANVGTLEILGDPDFLSSRANNYKNVKTNAESGKPNQLEDGSADFTYGEFFIEINFQVPQKINNTEKGGLMEIKKVPFSGVYKVTEIKSSFTDGIFKQLLTVIRMPGQILAVDDKNNKVPTPQQPVEVGDIYISDTLA